MTGRSRLLLLLVSLALMLPSAAAAQDPSAEEVKAAFLFRFASFVEWPAKSRSDEGIVFGVVNASGVQAELRRYAALRPIGDRPPVVRQVETAADLEGVHILFIGGRDASLSRWVAASGRLAILVVTDAPDGLERGSMLNFLTTDRVQFEASPAAATRAGLRLTSRLLSVASRVKKGDAGGEVVIASRDIKRLRANAA